MQSIELIEHPAAEITVLPSTAAVLGFQLRGRVRSAHGLLSTAGVTGIQGVARQYGYLGETVSILVRFTPQGASCFGLPSSQLSGASIALSELIEPARVREANERLLEAPHGSAQIAIIEQLLLGLPFAADALVARALEQLAASAAGEASVAAVARSLSLSERQLERRFLQRVGITPKRFAALRRFERALELARTAPSLTRVALAAGYYDQSHFIRDFRRFAGAPPSALLARPRADAGSRPR